MTITLASLRKDIRAKFQNLGLGTFTDDTLDVDIRQALWRLSRDRANEKDYSLLATGEKHNITTLITDWVPMFSTIRQVWKPIPTTSLSGTEPQPYDDWRLVPIGSTEYFFINGGITATGGALLIYTVPWRLAGVDDAVTTTVLEVLEPALLWLSAHNAALSMSAKAAGVQDKSIPADFVNFGTTKGDQYRRVAAEFEKAYREEIGLDHAHPKGIGIVRNYVGRRTDGEPWMTHPSRGVTR